MLFDSRHDIRPRAFRENVTLIRRVSATDEYGMQSLTLPVVGSGSGAGRDVSVIGVFPASVQMLSGYAKTNYYQTAEIEAYEIYMRYVDEKFERIIWNGIILNVDSREDVGMRRRTLRVLASRRAVV